MAIKREFESSGNYISTPGEYLVEIEEANAGKSKSGVAMLTVVFEAIDGKRINGFYCRANDPNDPEQVKKYRGQQKALSKLKEVCGLKQTDSATELVGKRCGIAVSIGNPKPEGGNYMKITGYGLVSEISHETPHTTITSDDVPF